jgi:hypothetical protein
MAVEHRDRLVAAEDAAVRAKEADVAAAQTRMWAELVRLRAAMESELARLRAAVTAEHAKFEASIAHREQAIAEHDALIATFQGEAAAAAQASATFGTTFVARLESSGLEDLDVRQVCELLRQLGAPVPFSLLEEQGVSGVVLLGITESEMTTVFKIRTLGARRRLSLALRRVAERRGFDAPPTLDWDIERVCAWLAEEGLVPLQRRFREEGVDGEVLLTLTREDLEYLGVSTLGGRAALMSKIELRARKQHEASHVVGGGAEGAAAAFGDPYSVEHQRLVLQQAHINAAETPPHYVDTPTDPPPAYGAAWGEQ